MKVVAPFTGAAGERKQCAEAPGIVFLIGSDQSAERQAITLSVTPVSSYRRTNAAEPLL